MKTARVLSLAGSRNLRDLGGYPTRDGRATRYGMLLRSGALHELDDEGVTHLRDLGVRTICDLRAPDERNEQPTPPLGGDVLTLAWDDAQEGMHRGLADGNWDTHEDGRQAMFTVYERLPGLHADKFRIMFQRIADGGVPMVLHCAAGKDRTGIAAALILSALGVEREVILEDYALSERTIDYLTVFRADAELNPESMTARYLSRPEPFVAAVVRSDPEYLEHALASIERKHGSIDGFLEEVLGVDGTRRTRMQNLLLQ
jgi:protein-tyrosine phosphatase